MNKNLPDKNLLTLLILFAALTAKAQVTKLLDTQHQLSSNRVNRLCQDSKGYVWIATQNGVNRYDGYHIRAFRRGEDSGLKSDFINDVKTDNNGNLYVATNMGVQHFDGRRFTDLPLKDSHGAVATTFVHRLCTLNDGSLVACTSGYGAYKLTATKAQRWEGTFPHLNYIRSVAQDRRGRLWIITENQGLKLLEGSHLVNFFDGEHDRQSVNDIAFAPSGDIYVATAARLFVMRAGQQKFLPVNIPGTHIFNTLLLLRNGDILVGCEGQGMLLLKTSIDHTGHPQIVDNPFASNNLTSTGRVGNFLEDKIGNIWISIFQKGVVIKSNYTTPFHTTLLDTGRGMGDQLVTYTHIDHLGRFWVVAYHYEFCLFQKEEPHLRHIAQLPFAPLSMTDTPDGNIWLCGWYNDCGWLSPDGVFHRAPFTEKGVYNCYGMAADQQGHVWVSTMGQGLCMVDKQGHLIRQYRSTPRAKTNPKINALNNDYLTKLYLSRDGRRLYVGTCSGLSCLDIATGSWLKAFGRNAINTKIMVNNIAEASDGSVWVVSDQELNRYSRQGQLLKAYNDHNALTKGSLSSIAIDKQGYVWVNVLQGIIKLNSEKPQQKQVFYASDCIQGNEFIEPIAISPDGQTLLIGGTKGISWMNIHDTQTRHWDPQLFVSDFIVNGQSRLPQDGKWHVDYADNSFVIRLSTFTFIGTENITYLYRLNNDRWTQLEQGSNEITFSHLPPGSYSFQVKAMWQNESSKVQTFRIYVGAPWYRTTWAYLIYLAILIALFLAYRRYRRGQEHARLLLQEHIHAEQLSEQRLKFFMSMSHEIRTPMTLIVTPLMQLIKEDHDTHRREVYRIIQRNAERILHLVNQMMDLRKIDQGLMTIHRREVDMVEFIDEICMTFRPQADAKRITFTFRHDDDHLPALIDRGNFDKVLVNILSNAFKYTQPAGHVIITLAQENTDIRIAISDDGENIPEDKLPHIFERFYQVPGRSNDEAVGTGIGLDLARSIVELHYGVIRAANNPGKGCTFTVVIPQYPELTKEETDLNKQSGMQQEVKEIGEALNDGAIMAENASVKSDTASGKRPVIAIVEDDMEIAVYLSAQLAKDYKVLSYHNGREALSGIQQMLPALVITDVMMPVMDGNELCARLKRNTNTNHIPVIMLTAKTADEDMIEGLESGADAYVAKPFNMNVLMGIIRNLIRERKVMRNKYAGNELPEIPTSDMSVVSADDQLMQRVIKVINDNLSDPALDVDKIAREAGVSRSKLYRMMKDMTNQTPHNYIRNLRLQMAVRMLRNQKMNITDITYACGFSSPSTFSTIFKNMFGVSPLNYDRHEDKLSR